MPNRKKDYNSPLSSGFRRRLRETREACHLTQEALAVAIGGLTRQTIAGLETGKFKASLEACEAIAAVLGVDPRWLAYGDETETSP